MKKLLTIIPMTLLLSCHAEDDEQPRALSDSHTAHSACSLLVKQCPTQSVLKKNAPTIIRNGTFGISAAWIAKNTFEYGLHALTRSVEQDGSSLVRIIPAQVITAAHTVEPFLSYIVPACAVYWVWHQHEKTVAEIALVKRGQDDLKKAQTLLRNAHDLINGLQQQHEDAVTKFKDLTTSIENLKSTLHNVTQQSNRLEKYQEGIITYMHTINEQFKNLKSAIDNQDWQQAQSRLLDMQEKDFDQSDITAEESTVPNPVQTKKAHGPWCNFLHKIGLHSHENASSSSDV